MCSEPASLRATTMETAEKGKIIVISAPSGTGKSTIIKQLMEEPDLRLGFSISATCRSPRGQERHGREYYFLTAEEFRARVDRHEFVEWEEVYPGCCYGTLRSEVERVTGSDHNLIMDIDVKGALSIKREFGPAALTIFIMPPSVEELGRRLRTRATDPEEVIQRRLEKAEYEISFAPQFDHTVVNDDLVEAVDATSRLIRDFIS